MEQKEKMNDESFARLVADDVKNKSTEAQKKYLHLPENIKRWKRALGYLDANLEEQIKQISFFEASKLKELEYLGDEGTALIAEASANFTARKSKIQRFDFFVKAKLDEVARLDALSSGTVSTHDSEDFYRRAIRKWWSLMEEFEMETTRIDEALHATLDGRWEFEGLTQDNVFGDFED